VAYDASGETRVLGEGQLAEPSAVAVARDRTLLVLDAGAGAIIRLQSSGAAVGRIAADQALYGPRGIAVAEDGRIAVADTGNNRIVLLTPTGSAVQNVTGLKEPTDVAFLTDGTLLVAETGAKQLVIVRPDGRRVADWSMPVAYTVVGPHVAPLPGGGWVATIPEARTLWRMLPNGRAPQPLAIDYGWRKPVGVAAVPGGVVVTDGDGGSAVLVGLP
jgi:sugar lactone lactonase YvrE